MTYSIVGTGNMAWFLVKRLKTAGHLCDGILGRNPVTTRELAAAMNVNSYQSITEINDGEVDICFIAVPDHEITEAVSRLSFEKTVLAHTAGFAGLDVLQAHANDCAMLWPVYSISKHSIPDHRNIPTAWEANTARSTRYITTMGHSITDNLFEAGIDKRKWLHLSAVIGNNFINHMVAICEDICKEQSLPFDTLEPILQQTFERLKQNEAKLLQTGPAKRRDTEVIQRQTDLLEQHPDWQNVYKAISSSIENMYIDKRH